MPESDDAQQGRVPDHDVTGGGDGEREEPAVQDRARPDPVGRGPKTGSSGTSAPSYRASSTPRVHKDLLLP